MLTARPLRVGEAELVSMALRRNRRFAALGLSRPPFPAELDAPLSLVWRGEPHRRRLAATLVFDSGDALVAIALDHGWDHDGDRLRRLVVLDLDSTGAARAGVVRAAARALTATRRCRAVRLRRAEVRPDEREQGATSLAVDGEVWLQLGGGGVQVTAPSPAAMAVREEDRRRQGAFAVRVVRRPPAAEVIVRDPAVAHGALLRSHRLWQHRFFPAAGPAEEADVVIIGGGVAGLTAAWALRDRRCVVLEAEDRLGGTAAVFAGGVGPFALGAHYDEAPDDSFGDDLLALYEALDLARFEEGDAWRFIDRGHDVAAERRKQTLAASGVIVRDPWNLLFTDSDAAALRATLERHAGRLPLPTRLTPPELRDEAERTFADWVAAHGLNGRPDLERLIDAALVADFGGSARQVSALAGLHYYANRPYLTDAVETFAPPQGIGWYVERLRRRTPDLDTRFRCLARAVCDRGDHVEVVALDLAARRTRRFLAPHVVIAAPKHQVRHLFPADRTLFAANRYAAWITVTLELDRAVDGELLCWSNTVEAPIDGFVGMNWANHATPEVAPQLTHYFVFPPARLGRVRALLASPSHLIRAALRQTAWFLHRDVAAQVRRVVIQKLGHAMPVPVTGVLLRDPNARRTSERVVYAGVDTGRLPLVAEALDSGLQAAAAFGVPQRASAHDGRRRTP